MTSGGAASRIGGSLAELACRFITRQMHKLRQLSPHPGQCCVLCVDPKLLHPNLVSQQCDIIKVWWGGQRTDKKRGCLQKNAKSKHADTQSCTPIGRYIKRCRLVRTEVKSVTACPIDV